MISQAEFSRRRRLLMDDLEDDSIAVLFSAPIVKRNRDSDYAYRQDSDFYYLSGFAEPESVIVLIPGRNGGEYVMFCRDKDPEKEIWDGIRLGVEGVSRELHVNEAHSITQLNSVMPALFEGKKHIYYSIGRDASSDQNIIGWLQAVKAKVRAGSSTPSAFFLLDSLLHELRLIKSSQEIKIMRQAATISARAHVRAMKACRAGLMEYQLEAEISHEFLFSGAFSPAYSSIVGGGANACILHYRDNNQKLEQGDLVLIDAGAEYQYYAGDITRTFPVSGEYTSAQKELYQLVLKAQKAAISMVKPGVSWNKPHEKAVQVLTAGLVKLGLLKGQTKDLIKSGAYRKFYMHRTGHWLGMDVHDVGEYKINGKWRVFEPGMVLTVEPGLYVAKNQSAVNAKWRGIGIRIEDDVLVTEDGCEVLSSLAPKEVDEIESLMA